MMHLFSIFIQFVFATDINQLNSVQFEEINKAPAIVFEFEKPVQTASLETRFIRRTVEWDLDKTKLKKDKLFVNVSKKDINNVYVSHNDENSVRVRINLDNGKIASNYHERISYLTEGKKLTILMDESIPLISDNIKELSRVYDLAKSTPKNEQAKKAEEHIAAINTMKVEDAAESKELVASHNALATINAKESEIPLSLKKENDFRDERSIPAKGGDGILRAGNFIGVRSFGYAKT